MADAINTTGPELDLEPLREGIQHYCNLLATHQSAKLLAALKDLSDATDMADEFEHQIDHAIPDETCPLCTARRLIAELEG